jgi:hypothetical protein
MATPHGAPLTLATFNERLEIHWKFQNRIEASEDSWLRALCIIFTIDSTIISMATGTLVPEGDALTISQGRLSELGRWSGGIGCKCCLVGPIV